MTRRPRAICPVCRRHVVARWDGDALFTRPHQNHDTVCGGSGREAADLAVEAPPSDSGPTLRTLPAEQRRQDLRAWWAERLASSRP